MSNSYRVIGDASGLIATLLFVGLIAFAMWSFKSIEEYQKANSDNRQEISSYKQETGEQYAKACLEEDRAVSAWAYCIVNSIDASRNAQRSNYDLKAQQEMAVWAYSLLLLTIGGFVISVVGLAALFLSLAQTRTAIKDTRDIGEAQVRAYMSEKRTSIGWLDWEVGGFTFMNIWQNTGQSPALGCIAYVDHKIADFDAAEDFISPFTERPRSAKVGNACASGGKFIGEGQSINGTTTERLEKKQSKLIIYSAVEYTDVFKTKWLAESCHVMVFPNDGDPKKISFRTYGHHNGYQKIEV
jgi:hypothetical protein